MPLFAPVTTAILVVIFGSLTEVDDDDVKANEDFEKYVKKDSVMMASNFMRIVFSVTVLIDDGDRFEKLFSLWNTEEQKNLLMKSIILSISGRNQSGTSL